MITPDSEHITPERRLYNSIQRLLPQLQFDPNENETTLEKFCIDRDINPSKLDAAPLGAITTTVERFDDGHWNHTTAKIDDSTLFWLSHHSVFNQLITDALKDRFARGLIRVPSLVKAYKAGAFQLEGRPDANLILFDGPTQVELFQRMMEDPNAWERFKYVLSYWVEDTTYPTRGEVIDKYINELLAYGIPDISSEPRMVDIGCSDGEIAMRIGKNIPTATVTGIDIVLPRNLKQIEGRVAFREADAFNLEKYIETGSFDAALLLNILRHHNAYGKTQLLTSAANILKDRGLLFIGTLQRRKESKGYPENFIRILQKRYGELQAIDILPTDDI